MKKVLIGLLAVVNIMSFAACNRQYNPLETENIEITPPPLDYRTAAERWYDTALQQYNEQLPYVSIVPTDEQTRQELEAIPEKFEEYKENFDVEFENADDFTDMLVTGALSDSAYDRHAVAGRTDCPVELLVKIARDDPDRVVRYRAQGNILSKDEMDEEYLLDLAASEYADARLTAIMHTARTAEVISTLVDDPDTDVSKQANEALQQP